MGRFIREQATEGSTVAVFGSEPEIYFYSGHHSATGFIYIYDLVENEPFALEMQKRMIQEIEAAKPEYFVLVNSFVSWLPNSNAPRLLSDWGSAYCRDHYMLVGVVDLISPGKSVYVWGDQVSQYQIKSNSQILVFKRQPET